MNRFPGNEDTKRCEESGQHDQPHGEAIHAHVVVDVWAGDPLLINFVLEARLGAVEVHGQMQRQHERKQSDDQRKESDITVAPRNQQQQQPAGERNECN